MTAPDDPLAGRDGLREDDAWTREVVATIGSLLAGRDLTAGGAFVKACEEIADALRPIVAGLVADATEEALTAPATPDGPTPFCPRCGQALGQSHTQGECDAGFARAITPDGPTPATAGLTAAERNEVCTCTPRSVGLIGRLTHSHECTLHRQAVERILAARIARGEP